MSGPSHDPSDYRERDAIPIRRALVSVSDKTGLVELATALAAAGGIWVRQSSFPV
ncbi:MAG TPA: bifunctional phosphoribosylaminoimidazolecarboxamide formyltransferase/IMP cyclohydrolase, partial [Rhodoglobus sp.]|nr:bifunctional phosphoribosylaminoimidazolecarboxamide formyltransferase/IMP cyclohydrolase [Rhodoglobus sp.]